MRYGVDGLYIPVKNDIKTTQSRYTSSRQGCKNSLQSVPQMPFCTARIQKGKRKDQECGNNVCEGKFCGKHGGSKKTKEVKEKKTVKRPDIAEKRKNKKFQKHFVREVSLSRLLSSTFAADQVSRLAGIIESNVVSCSKLLHERSTFINILFADLLQNKRHLIQVHNEEVVGGEGGVEEEIEDHDLSEEAEDVHDGIEDDIEDAVDNVNDDLQEEDIWVPDLSTETSQKTFFRQCFTVGVIGCTAKNPHLRSRLVDWGYLPSQLQKPSLNNVLTHGSNGYVTVFNNHLVLWDSWIKRIKRYATSLMHGCRRAIQDDDASDDEEEQGGQAAQPRSRGISKVMELVLRPDTESSSLPYDVPTKEMSVATHIRSLLVLRNGQPLTERHLKANLWIPLNAISIIDEHFANERHEMRRIMENDLTARFYKGAGRGLILVPEHKRKAHFIHIDPTDSLHLFHQAGIANNQGEALTASEIKEVFVRGLGRIFGDKTARWYNGMITTDGVKACVHFTKRLTEEELADKINRKKSSKKSPSSTKTPSVTSSDSIPDLVLVTDPGRVNIMFVSVFYKGQPFRVTYGSQKKTKPLRFIMTAGHYYTNTGVRRGTILKRRWRHGLRDSDRLLSQSTRRTSDPAVLRVRAETLRATSASNWKVVMRRKVRNQDFRQKAGKTRCLDRFFASVKKKLRIHFTKEEVDTCHMAWGDATFSSSGKGNAPVPSATPKVRARRWFDVKMTSEWGTSTACAKCFSFLHAVRVRTKGCVKFVCHSHIPSKVARSIRKGLVKGLLAKRSWKKVQQGNKVVQGFVPALRKTKAVICEVLDGHGGQTVEEKRRAKVRRSAEGSTARYIRGLRFCPGCQELCDRDAYGTHGIFVHYCCSQRNEPPPDIFTSEGRKRLREQQE